VYFKAGDGPWKAARIIWNIDGPADEGEP